jgi:hypothetical protein
MRDTLTTALVSAFVTSLCWSMALRTELYGGCMKCPIAVDVPAPSECQKCADCGSRSEAWSRSPNAKSRQSLASSEPAASFDQAMRWYSGTGGEMIDYKRAAAELRRCADAGHAAAAATLGVCYKHGQGVPKSAAEAELWARKVGQSGLCAVSQKRPLGPPTLLNAFSLAAPPVGAGRAGAARGGRAERPARTVQPGVLLPPWHLRGPGQRRGGALVSDTHRVSIRPAGPSTNTVHATPHAFTVHAHTCMRGGEPLRERVGGKPLCHRATRAWPLQQSERALGVALCLCVSRVASRVPPPPPPPLRAPLLAAPPPSRPRLCRWPRVPRVSRYEQAPRAPRCSFECLYLNGCLHHCMGVGIWCLASASG